MIVFLFWGTKLFAYDANLEQAVQLYYNADFNQAISLLDSYIASHPNDPMGYMVRGSALDWKQHLADNNDLDVQALENYKMANKLAFTQWNQDQGNLDKMVILGNSHMYLSKKWLDLDKKSRAGLILKKAKLHMEKVIQDDPNRLDAMLALGIFNFYTANIPAGLKMIASLMGMNGNESKGLEYLNRVADTPNLFQTDALFLLTHAIGKTKRNYMGAIPYLDRLIQKYSNNPIFLHIKGEYAQRGKKYDVSRKAFDQYFSFCQGKSANMCPKLEAFLAHYYLGSGYMEEGKFAEAKGYLEKAEELNENKFPDRTVRLNYNKGMVAKGLGNKNEASAAFQKAIDLGKDNKEVEAMAKKELMSIN